MTQLSNPAAVSVNFSNGTSHLSKNAMRSLAALSSLLASGAHLVITGYAHASGKLARNRAHAVEAFVRQRLQIAVTFKIEIATSTSAEKVTVFSTQP
jgi:predicted deacetylase